MNSFYQRALAWIFVFHLVCYSIPAQLHATINHGGDINPVPPSGGGPVTGPFRIGNDNVGFMHIADGTGLKSSNNSIVGNAPNSIGIVTMDGFGSNWELITTSGDLTVGASGVGSVMVMNLAKMDVADQTILGSSATGYGEITVEGIGSQWLTDDLIVGQSGHGMANLTYGGRLNTDVLTIGNNSAGQGRVVVTDPMSYLTVSGPTNVGSSGKGEMFIENAGRVRTSASAVVGSSNNSVGLIQISDSGSSLDVGSGNLTIGSTGTGRLKIFNGGKANIADNLQLASTTGSFGEVLVEGNNSLIIAGSISTGAGESLLTVASAGVVSTGSIAWGTKARMKLVDGRLEASESLTNHGLIEGTGTIEVSTFNNAQSGFMRGRMQIAAEERLLLTGTLSNSGLVDVDGGELEIIGNVTNNFDISARNGAKLRFGNLGLDNNSGSRVAITAGEVDVFGNVQNDAGAQIIVGNGASAVFHNTLTNNGALYVMPGANLFAIEQIDFATNSSILNLHLSAADVFGEFFPVEVGGTVSLGGELAVTLSSGYEPQLGDVFPLLISTGDLNSDFSQWNFPALPAGLAWETLRTANSLSLEVVASGSADFDGDGDVDGRDFLAWQRNQSIGDLADWQVTYGVGSLFNAGVIVPEPASLALGLTIVGLFSVCRRYG